MSGNDPWHEGWASRLVEIFIGAIGYGITAYIAFQIGVGYGEAGRSVPVTCPPEPPDAWIVRRIGYCDQTCAGVPFQADVTVDSTSCYCDRPAKLEPMKLKRRK